MKQIQPQTLRIMGQNIGALRVIVTTVGCVGGLISMEHGIFEILQGNIATNGLFINAIGPAQRLWEGAGELAFTIIPNFLITGIFAVVFGILGLIWSIAFVHKRYGSLGLFILSVTQYLVGGGIAFLIVAIFNSLIATRINKPFVFLSKMLSLKVRNVLGNLWLWLIPLIAFVITFPIPIFIVIIGVKSMDASSTENLAWILGDMALVFLIFSIIMGFVHDIKSLDDKEIQIVS